MCRNLLFLLVAVTAALTASGQEADNRYFCGVNLFAVGRSQRRESVTFYGTSEGTLSTFELTALPQIGMNMSAKLRLGMALGYQHHSEKYINRTNGAHNDDEYIFANTYFVRGFVSRDFRISERLNIFAQTNLDLAEREITEGSEGGYEATYTRIYVSSSITPGLRWKANRFDVELLYGSIGYVKGEQSIDGTDDTIAIKQLDVDFTSSSLLLGVKYSF